MDYLPSSSVTLIHEGRYDAFPVAAAHGDTVIGMWRSAKAYGHATDTASTIKAVTSADGGRTYSTSRTVTWSGFSDSSYATPPGPVGLVWDATRELWVLLAILRRWNDAAHSGTSVGAMLVTSPDGVTWRKLKDLPPVTGGWFFASGLATDGAGRWAALGYGQLPGAPRWTPLTMVTSDAGESWSPTVAPSGLPDVNLSEPQAVRLASGDWLMAARSDDPLWTVHLFRSKDGINWVFDSAPIGGVSGMPTLGVTGTGDVVMLLRQRPTVDTTHGPWLWASSSDEGRSWTVREDFPGGGRYMMYGGLARVADGSLACVFASEDDPSQLWATSSVYAMRFAYTPLMVAQKSSRGVPYTEIIGSGQSHVVRVSQTRQGEVRDIVRVPILGGAGGARDYELQQGQACRYEVDGRSTDVVTGPVLPQTLIVHPSRPSKSIVARIITDNQRSYDVAETTTVVPSTARSGEQYPVVTYSGRLGAASGATVIETRTEDAEDMLLDCLGDLTPLFWSHHPGLRLPEWFCLTDLKSERVAQICPCGCGHELDSLGHWRHWTITWVKQPRPGVDELPYRHTIGEIDVPIGDIDLPIGSI